MTSCQVVSSSIWADAAIIATLLGALVFVVAYSWRTRGAWKNSAVGMNVMAFMVSVLIVASLAAAGIFWGTDWPNRNVVRTLAWGLIAACIWWRVAILFKIQHRDE